jgi:hypothetical protein
MKRRNAWMRSMENGKEKKMEGNHIRESSEKDNGTEKGCNREGYNDD